MKRHLLFFALVLFVFLLWMFPHRMLVERLLLPRARAYGVSIEIASVAPSWPPGYSLYDTRLATGPYRIAFERVRLLLGVFGIRRAEISACGGHIVARLGTHDSARSAVVTLQDVDPASCLKIDDFKVGGSFDGRIDVVLTEKRSPPSAQVVLDAREGEVSGLMPSGMPRGTTPPERMPIGAWTFSALHLEGRSEGQVFTVVRGNAKAEGVAWEIDGLRLARRASGSVSLSGDLRARRDDGSKRSKAIIGLLPKAPQRGDGWHYYRVSGTLDAPHIVGLL